MMMDKGQGQGATHFGLSIAGGRASSKKIPPYDIKE